MKASVVRFLKISGISCAIAAAAMLFISQSSEHLPFFDSLSERPVSYLYAPGLMGSEIVMGRYCPRFTAMTGERITWKTGGHVIGQPHSAVAFPEIDLYKPQGFTLNPITSLCNGIRQDLFPIAERFFCEKYGITIEDNPDSPETVANYSFNFGRGNIAQKKDIQALQKTYRAHLKKYPETDVVLYGDSRGSATIFNFIALNNPPEVKAAIMEGIFDDVPHLLKHFIYNHKDHRTEQRLHTMLSWIMRSYKKRGPFPRDYAETIGDAIPMLFVTSRKDWLVPSQCTAYLYNRLRERGHRNVHILVLENSSHPGYMVDNPEDKQTYESVVHAFYKQYGLPHNRAQAVAGQAAFARTQPTCEELQERYQLPSCERCFCCHA